MTTHPTGGKLEPTPQNIAKRVTEKLFEKRRGHGGGECSYRQFRPDEFQAVIEEAINLYASVAGRAALGAKS